MSPGPIPVDEDALACVRRLLREAPPTTGMAGPPEAKTSGPAEGRLVLTPAHRVGEASSGAHPAPVLVLSDGLRAAPPEARSGLPGTPTEGRSLDEAAIRRIVAEAVREALGASAIRDLVRREVLQMLDDREG